MRSLSGCKIIIYGAVFFIIPALSIFAQPGNTTTEQPALKPLIESINNTKNEIKNAESEIVSAQAELDAKQPDLMLQRDKKKAEAEDIKYKHDKKYPVTSADFQYWNNQYKAALDAARVFQEQIDRLIFPYEAAILKKQEAEARLSQLSRQLLVYVQLYADANCAKQLSVHSTTEEILQCWSCFFEGGCNDYAKPPVEGKGMMIIPNDGAPQYFTMARNQQLQNISRGIQNIKVPPPPTAPPQKSITEQATEKVRNYFRDVINQSSRLKRRITTAPGAVRG
jgi:electron transfer flavoprotein alpha subunit